jgi:hypothetical protein
VKKNLPDVIAGEGFVHGAIKCPNCFIQFPTIEATLLLITSLAGMDIHVLHTWALAITHEASEYAFQQFTSKKAGGDGVIPAAILDTHLVIACDQVVDRLLQAYHNSSGC